MLSLGERCGLFFLSGKVDLKCEVVIKFRAKFSNGALSGF